MTLQATWYILVYVLLIGYAILDGMDLGVGILHLAGRTDRARRASLQTIAPTWDGNEVWLLTGGGALFAAFPPVYAMVFSAFYLALVLLLVALIARAVAIEFRSRVESPRWQRVWDVVFAVGSFLPALLLGVAFGNILIGIPINESSNYTGTFFGLLNPCALGAGLASVGLFTLQGALLLAHKLEGPLQEPAVRRLPKVWAMATALLIVAAAAMALGGPGPWFESPAAWTLGPATIAAMLCARFFIRRRRYGEALVASSAVIATTMGMAAVMLFPVLVPSTLGGLLPHNLTIGNSSSTPRTLTAMLVIALVGMPIVLAYTIYVHRIFKGKVAAGDEGY